jgi:DNA end-binding protein Ku
VALAKVRLRTRTRLALLRPRDGLLALDTMRFAQELLAADEVTLPEETRTSAREMQLAEHLVDELSGPFDPGRHPDDYRSAVLAAVEDKVGTGQVVREEQPAIGRRRAAAGEGGRVVQLTDLLSRSLQVAARPGPAKARPPKAPARAKARAS